MSTLKTTYIQHPSAAGPAIELTADGNLSMSNPPAKVVNTDGNPGYTIFVGATDPSISYTMVPGDIWIEVPA